jgi:hypothetical protein
MKFQLKLALILCSLIVSGGVYAQLNVKSNGNIGIGISEPLGRLHIYSDPAAALILQGNDNWIGMEYRDGNSKQVGITGFMNIGNGVRSFDIFNYKHHGMISFFVYDSTLSWPQASKMVIDSMGNVGIGTTSPTAKLQVAGEIFISGSEPKIDFYNNSGTSDRMIIRKNPSNFGEINVLSAHDLRLRTSDQDRLTVKSGGNVGIGTTDPTEKLDVEGNLDMNQNQIKNFRIENRTSDPASPAVGQIWIRTDL